MPPVGSSDVLPIDAAGIRNFQTHRSSQRLSRSRHVTCRMFSYRLIWSRSRRTLSTRHLRSIRSNNPDFRKEGVGTLPSYSNVFSAKIPLIVNDVRLDDGVLLCGLRSRSLCRRTIQTPLNQSKPVRSDLSCFFLKMTS